MALLGTGLLLLVLGQGCQIGGIELETGGPIRGLSRFHEYGPGYFGTGGHLRRSGRQNRGPLVLGRYGRRRNRNLSVRNDTHSQETGNFKIPGSNGAASNNGGIIKWENVTARFSWRRKRQTVGKAFILILF